MQSSELKSLAEEIARWDTLFDISGGYDIIEHDSTSIDNSKTVVFYNKFGYPSLYVHYDDYLDLKKYGMFNEPK